MFLNLNFHVYASFLTSFQNIKLFTTGNNNQVQDKVFVNICDKRIMLECNHGASIINGMQVEMHSFPDGAVGLKFQLDPTMWRRMEDGMYISTNPMATSNVGNITFGPQLTQAVAKRTMPTTDGLHTPPAKKQSEIETPPEQPKQKRSRSIIQEYDGADMRTYTGAGGGGGGPVDEYVNLKVDKDGRLKKYHYYEFDLEKFQRLLILCTQEEIDSYFDIENKVTAIIADAVGRNVTREEKHKLKGYQRYVDELLARAEKRKEDEVKKVQAVAEEMDDIEYDDLDRAIRIGNIASRRRQYYQRSRAYHRAYDEVIGRGGSMLEADDAGKKAMDDLEPLAG